MDASQIFCLEKQITSRIEAHADLMGKRGDDYHTANKIWRELFEKHTDKLNAFVNREAAEGSSAKLRELSSLVGFDYWGNLDHANAIDWLGDAIHLNN